MSYRSVNYYIANVTKNIETNKLLRNNFLFHFASAGSKSQIIFSRKDEKAENGKERKSR